MYSVEKLLSLSYKKYSKSNLPMKYINHDLGEFRILGDNKKDKKLNEDMFEKFMDYYNNAEENLKKGKGLMLCGSVGIAKTWLLTHLAKHIIDIFEEENIKISEQIEEGILKDDVKMNNFYYIQATTISQMIFTTGLNEQELKVRRGIKAIAGLWIDDISKMTETKSGIEISFLDDILRYRDLNSLPTFYTSQIPFDSKGDFIGFDKAIGRAIHDMIKGNCEIIIFTGDSQR
jgi:DNA replication protein DnaC